MANRGLPALAGAIGLGLIALGLAAAAPRSENDFAPLITNPTWMRLPSADRIAAYYPEVAVQKNRGGGAVVACRVRKAGFLENCTVITEAPEGFDFGAAALRMAVREFRMNPTTVAGKPIDGGLVIVPITFYPFGMGEMPRIDYQAGDAAVLLAPSATGTIPCATAQEGARKCKGHLFEWEERPELYEVDSALVRAGALNGVSQINCRADANNRLVDCRLLGETGPAAQSAVAALAPLFKLPAKTHDGEAMGENRIVVTFNWPHIREILENIRTAARSPLKS